jgi:hypothetical protein
MLMSFTLTDTQAVPALQLLQQPFFHLQRRLWIQYNQIECVGKNKLSSVTVPTVKERLKWYKSTDYYPRQYMKLRDELHAAAMHTFF